MKIGKRKQEPIFSALVGVEAKPVPGKKGPEPCEVQLGGKITCPSAGQENADLPISEVLSTSPDSAPEVASSANSTIRQTGMEPVPLILDKIEGGKVPGRFPTETEMAASDLVGDDRKIIGSPARELISQTSDAIAEPPSPFFSVIDTLKGVGQSPVHNSLEMTFNYIVARTFIMGSYENEFGRTGNEIPHEVTLTKDFYLQVAPVTQKQWQALMGDSSLKASHCKDNYPVAGVSWTECQEFIKRLNAKGEGVYRLPTEAEWEYCCRAGSTTPIANGDIVALYCELDPNLDELGWYCGNSKQILHQVAQKEANSWGLYDMHGGVWEWCQDWYGEYPSSAVIDPTGSASGSKRVVRGGSWSSSAKSCRSANRFCWTPHAKAGLFPGFRLLREL